MNPSLKKLLGSSWRLYAFACVTAINVLVLFVIVAIIAAALSPASPPAYSRHFNLDSYRLIDRATAIDVGREFDIIGDHESFLFHPWTVCISRPFHGRWLTIEDSLTRRTTHTPPPDSRPEYVIWMFGGSTLFGWGMPDELTIPSQLQALLNEQCPRVRVRILNFGHPYFYSSTEVALFASLLRRGKPNLVVFLDGFNDTHWLNIGHADVPAFSEDAHLAWERERARRYGAPWWPLRVEMVGTSPLVRALDRIRQSLGGSSARVLPRHAIPSAPAGGQPVDLGHFTLDAFAANRRMEDGLASASGVALVRFLQPVPFYPPPIGKRATHEARIYASLVGDPSTGFHLLTDALDGIDTPYVDGAHYSDIGSRRVAERIAAVLAPRVAAGP